MHPAPSVIIFPTLSGLGFGFLAWLGLNGAPPTEWTAFAMFFIACALAVGGLVSSTVHLGRPERALLAFTQWRTSWLSREGICAIAALIVMGLYAAALVFAGTHVPVLGWIGAALSVLTVFTTSMIYAQLPTIPRWNTMLTPALYLSYSLAGGTVISGIGRAAVLCLLLTAVVQLLWWSRGDKAFATSGTTMATATGLGTLGTVRSVAHPHTSPNWLLKEFVFKVGRKHAQKLRVISLGLMAAVPILLLVAAGAAPLMVALAAVSHAAGVAVSRWLFFAEAEHTVGLYYGLR